jgi:hypothetical protein
MAAGIFMYGYMVWRAMTSGVDQLVNEYEAAARCLTELPTMRIRPSPRANCLLAVRVTDD